MAKSRKPFSLQLKRPKKSHLYGTKSCLKEKLWLKTSFFLGILKNVCLSVDRVPKLIQDFFSTMEQKFVQWYETEVVADVCNASKLVLANVEQELWQSVLEIIVCLVPSIYWWTTHTYEQMKYTSKNSAYGRHWICQPMRIVAPILFVPVFIIRRLQIMDKFSSRRQSSDGLQEHIFHYRV